jgi:hypothetical protein
VGVGPKEELGGVKKRPPGNQPYEPTDEVRAKVRLWAAVGTTQEVIASELGISVDTLTRYYRAELDEASARGVANVAANLYTKAMAGDVTSMIFYLKTRGRWREKPSAGDDENPFVMRVDGAVDPLDAAMELAKRAARAKKPDE